MKVKVPATGARLARVSPSISGAKVCRNTMEGERPASRGDATPPCHGPTGLKARRQFLRAAIGAWALAATVATGWAGETVCVPAGTFAMGDPFGRGSADERPVHTVALSAFHMDRTEVSNAEMCRVMQWALGQALIVAGAGSVTNVQGRPQELLDLDDWNSEIHFTDGQFAALSGREAHPCVEVTWYGAQAYATYRSRMEGLESCIDLGAWTCDFSRNGYRLPTEAEWERAARGGLDGQQFPWPSAGADCGALITGACANYWESGDPFATQSVTQTTPVGYYDGRQEPPGPSMANGFGLFDMAGNVYEWCWDYYDEAWYQQRAATSPNCTGPSTGYGRVVRGGSFLSGSREDERGDTTRGSGFFLRCSNRTMNDPANGRFNRGFRCVRRP